MNELSWSTLLLVLPVVFAIGWFSSRMDLRQWRRAERDSPRAYYKGLNLLLNEQQDKAIDAFIEAVQNDPDTTELHFALGNLFRRRGEFERSVRVHQHLLARADLSKADRDRAQHALAQDYMKAGLFDRAEAAYRALEGTSFDHEAHQALLGLYERSHEWPQALEMAQKLEASGAGSYATRMSHHLCEQALELKATDAGQAHALLLKAHELAPLAVRPLVTLGQWQAQQGDAMGALASWSKLLRLSDAPVALVAPDLVALVREADEHLRGQALNVLRAAYERQPSLPVLLATLQLQPQDAQAALLAHLQRHPSLSAAAAVLKLPRGHDSDDAVVAVQQAVDRSSLPLQRYRCAACGFEAQRYFWQCPGCLTWDSYPTQRIEEL